MINVVLDLGLPVILTVGEVPLITQGHHTLLARPSDYHTLLQHMEGKGMSAFMNSQADTRIQPAHTGSEYVTAWPAASISCRMIGLASDTFLPYVRMTEHTCRNVSGPADRRIITASAHEPCVGP